MPTLEIELDHAQYDWLAKNTKDIDGFINRLVSAEMERSPSRECIGLYRLLKPIEEGHRPTAGNVISLAREYVFTCRAVFDARFATHRYSHGGADLFSIAIPKEIRGMNGELPLGLGSGTRLINMTFSTGFDGDRSGRWVGFLLKMADPAHRTVTLKGTAPATDDQCDELAGIFDRKWNDNTGAYSRKSTEGKA